MNTAFEKITALLLIGIGTFAFNLFAANGALFDAAQTDSGFVEGTRAKVAAIPSAMSRAEIEAGLRSRDRALYILADWIRDPYITLGPDDFYYLTGTTYNENDPREKPDPENLGLGRTGNTGKTVRLWKSRDLMDWQYQGVIYDLEKDSAYDEPGDRIWAPEVHWIPEMNRWVLVHCPREISTLALSAGPELKGPWTHPMGAELKGRHDPSVFKDGDSWWLLSGNTVAEPLAADFSSLTDEAARIDPTACVRTNSQGKVISTIGHEGATLIKIGDKYVHLGTAWSTEWGRRGSYNLYYCTSDKITGPYGPRKFAGRFLGHGTPFQTRDGKWWCTAFINASVPPLPREGIETRDLSDNAYSINQRGTTIVPLEVKVQADGDVYIRALDPAYATPGPDELQRFE